MAVSGGASVDGSTERELPHSIATNRRTSHSAKLFRKSLKNQQYYQPPIYFALLFTEDSDKKNSFSSWFSVCLPINCYNPVPFWSVFYCWCHACRLKTLYSKMEWNRILTCPATATHLNWSPEKNCVIWGSQELTSAMTSLQTLDLDLECHFTPSISLSRSCFHVFLVAASKSPPGAERVTATSYFTLHVHSLQ